MDKSIRLNKICVIGQPRCDFVFSSTRTCFIAYGFEESSHEMTIISAILEERGIRPEEAGGTLAPGQNAFCAKICSKIITSQFCVILLNNDEIDGNETPNANVNMEYGLMLGFNKYIIPFQRYWQKLPFNVAGLDTIKYTEKNLKSRASRAIDQAIVETQQEAAPPLPLDQIFESFFLAHKYLITSLDSQGEKDLYNLGRPLGFNLLNDFSGMNYMYFGNFMAFRAETAIQRVNLLVEILDGRRATFDERIRVGLMPPEQAPIYIRIFKDFKIWVAVTSDADKKKVSDALKTIDHEIQVFSTEDVTDELGLLENSVNSTN